MITMLDEPEIRAKRLDGQLWYEIDDIQDLDIAASMFAPDDEKKVELIQQRYGGYWRYPKMLDFCYLVNPYFPPQRLMDEVKANFEALFTQYPSGMRVNSLLAGKNFGVGEEQILVGNGAAELIKSLMGQLQGRTGLIRPTFEEYPNRYREEDEVVFLPENENFTYTASDLKEFFEDKEIKNLILVNPDNPTGNYLSRTELLELAAWTGRGGIRLIVDESFADFSEEGSTLIEREILEQYPHLYVMKSISKSYGVPGLRLGVMASGDTAAVSRMKKDVAIWNINSFAEFYMQIEEKYKKDYARSLGLLREERERFYRLLERIPEIRVIPSQANYMMAEIINGMTSKELTKRLLLGHHIFIKDLSGKINRGNRQFVRIAVRNAQDNDRLGQALKDELQGRGSGYF